MIKNKDYKKEKLVEILVNKGKEVLDQPSKLVYLTGHIDADRLLNDFKKYPHAFVLACIMDRQIKAERAWLIPYRISQAIGGFGFPKLLTLSREQTKELFKKGNLHRFNAAMADNFYFAVRKIHTDYKNNASRIWSDRPSSATIVRRFLQFKGVGIKIATMAANILARNFKVPMKDYLCIDISPDVHNRRVFKRVGFVDDQYNIDEVIYTARELNPEYPGIFDLSCWEIGREWCRPRKPDCESCYLNIYCPYNKESPKSCKGENRGKQDPLRIVLVSCASKKLPYRAKAMELYISSLFRYNLEYAKSLKPDKIFILSAKYGLLDPNEKIRPYNKTLNSMPAEDIKDWAGNVLARLNTAADFRKDKFIFLAGEEYHKYLTPYITNYKVPFKNMRIGEQLKELRKITSLNAK